MFWTETQVWFMLYCCYCLCLCWKDKSEVECRFVAHKFYDLVWIDCRL